MTITTERPIEQAAPISENRIRRIAVGLAVADDLLGRVDYARLPDLHAVSVAAWTTSSATEVHAQLGANGGDVADARAVLAWRDAVPGGRVTITAGGRNSDRPWWQAAAHLPVAGGTFMVWTHLHGLTEEQAARLERQPEAAYAVLVDLAREAA